MAEHLALDDAEMVTVKAGPSPQISLDCEHTRQQAAEMEAWQQAPKAGIFDTSGLTSPGPTCGSQTQQGAAPRLPRQVD